MEYSNTLNDEKMSAIKAQRGIENMEELYRQLQESEQGYDEEGEGEDKENENNGNNEIATNDIWKIIAKFLFSFLNIK